MQRSNLAEAIDNVHSFQYGTVERRQETQEMIDNLKACIETNQHIRLWTILGTPSAALCKMFEIQGRTPANSFFAYYSFAFTFVAFGVNFLCKLANKDIQYRLQIMENDKNDYDDYDDYDTYLNYLSEMLNELEKKFESLSNEKKMKLVNKGLAEVGGIDKFNLKFICPITQSLICQPYVLITKDNSGTLCSEIYDYDPGYWKSGTGISPLTRLPLSSYGFFKNVEHREYLLTLEKKLNKYTAP